MHCCCTAISTCVTSILLNWNPYDQLSSYSSNPLAPDNQYCTFCIYNFGYSMCLYLSGITPHHSLLISLSIKYLNFTYVKACVKFFFLFKTKLHVTICIYYICLYIHLPMNAWVDFTFLAMYMETAFNSYILGEVEVVLVILFLFFGGISTLSSSRLLCSLYIPHKVSSLWVTKLAISFFIIAILIVTRSEWM